MTQAEITRILVEEFDINAIYARHLARRVAPANAVQDAQKILEEKPTPFVKWVGGKRQLLKQFRELGLYPPDGALVCDDTLYIKITEPGREFVGSYYAEGAPYPGAKPHMQIPEDLLDDRDWLSELVRVTADAFPLPEKKAKKKNAR